MWLVGMMMISGFTGLKWMLASRRILMHIRVEGMAQMGLQNTDVSVFLVKGHRQVNTM